MSSGELERRMLRPLLSFWIGVLLVRVWPLEECAYMCSYTQLVVS